MFYFIHPRITTLTTVSVHVDHLVRATAPKSLRSFHQPGQVVWFPVLEDASSEILQEDNFAPCGYKEVGIVPSTTTGYHHIVTKYLSHSVSLVVHRGVGFMMGRPNKTDQSDE